MAGLLDDILDTGGELVSELSSGIASTIAAGGAATASVLRGGTQSSYGALPTPAVHEAIRNGPIAGVARFRQLWNAANPNTPFDLTDADTIAKGLGSSGALRNYALPFVRKFGISKTNQVYGDFENQFGGSPAGVSTPATTTAAPTTTRGGRVFGIAALVLLAWMFFFHKGGAA